MCIRDSFDTGVDQTLGGYVHIKINCGASRSQLVPGHASTNSRLTTIKDGDYYEQYRYRVQVGTDCGIFGIKCWGRGEGDPIYETRTAYRQNDGGESYASQLVFTAEIELIFKMFAPATNTFASNSQGTNLWASTLPGGVSD